MVMHQNMLPIAIGALKALRDETRKLWIAQECLVAELLKQGYSVERLGHLLESAHADPLLREQAEAAVGFRDQLDILEEEDRKELWRDLEARPQQEIDEAVQELLKTDYRSEL